MWVNRQLRRDYPGNTSKVGLEVLKRRANRETPRPGHASERDLDHPVSCPIPHGRRGDPGENAPNPRATCPWGGMHAFKAPA